MQSLKKLLRQIALRISDNSCNSNWDNVSFRITQSPGKKEFSFMTFYVYQKGSTYKLNTFVISGTVE